MKCPKCGFNSFEYYDSCKKCSADLAGYKQTYSIDSIVLPFEAKEKLVAELRSSESAADQIADTTETHDDIFSFDLPDESPPAPSPRVDDPFNFDEPSPEVQQSARPQFEDDIFGDLLESTSQAQGSPFAVAADSVIPGPAAVKAADISSEPGEFDLENFSWDDTPKATTPATATDSTDAADDFDSLFGDMKESKPK